MPQPMTKEEFVEMLTIMLKRTKDGVLAARRKSDVGSEKVEDWASLAESIHGRIYVDDSDIAPVRETSVFGQTRSVTPMFALDEIDTWPDGLFRKLSSYIWWIDQDDEINPLDVMAAE